jgi:hypothetical protein
LREVNAVLAKKSLKNGKRVGTNAKDDLYLGNKFRYNQFELFDKENFCG